MSLLLDLFLNFAKIGLFTFGGGYAMIALIENACVEKKQWITHDEMMNITVIAESTPGPIAINCATYVGYKQKGFIGAVGDQDRSRDPDSGCGHQNDPEDAEEMDAKSIHDLCIYYHDAH